MSDTRTHHWIDVASCVRKHVAFVSGLQIIKRRTTFMSVFILSRSAAAVALAAGLAVAPCHAEDRHAADPGSHRQAAASSESIPACLDGLTLSQTQQEQIKGIVGEYDADIAKVWTQFGDIYMETIRTEAALLTAIEDNLTEPQLKQVRDQRRRTARHQKALAGTEDRPNQATAKPASAVEDEIAIVGISLSAEQELAADKLQEKCLNRLRSLNRDVQGLHTRLVSLEADKLVEIENVLTKEQLVQLRTTRQNAPIASRFTAQTTAPSAAK